VRTRDPMMRAMRQVERGRLDPPGETEPITIREADLMIRSIASANESTSRSVQSLASGKTDSGGSTSPRRPPRPTCSRSSHQYFCHIGDRSGRAACIACPARPLPPTCGRTGDRGAASHLTAGSHWTRARMRGKKTRERVTMPSGRSRGDPHVIASRAPMAPPSVHTKPAARRGRSRPKGRDEDSPAMTDTCQSAEHRASPPTATGRPNSGRRPIVAPCRRGSALPAARRTRGARPTAETARRRCRRPASAATTS
jgi:hypothetical protein